MSSEAMGRPTLESVARQAAVSRQTVSNVLNAPHLVRPETLDRVRAVIDELGYRPHRAARTLRTRRSYLIAARMHAPEDGIGGAVLDAFIHALTLRAQEREYRVMLFAADDDQAEIAEYDQLLGDHDLDAFVLTGTHLGDERTAWLTGRGAAFVTFGRPWGADDAGHAWVDVDGAAGTYDATRHLVRRGHRRIAFLGWPEGSGVGDDRREGWRRACAEAGLETADLTRAVLDSLPTGRAAGAELLDLPDPPTAIVCVSDSLALGAWTEITARGLTPGRDVSVVGFDDSPTASVIGMSSVAQPVDDVARVCIDQLEQLLAERAGPAGSAETGVPAYVPAPVLLPPSLVVRASS
ncbi:MAG TPA: LacI family DNA-binding transcriptional regulator [Actinocrinis sp.]|uniref:LacI family DNA-binding transcriptional regulator n=1 Tax=Actinocrinis sp. TaxID=1920516 RepID=UPI002DDCBD54|nr:LacI family DNA-binding transcriptional regulator [Actinocrinis sp.]HEV2345516.1 LacI family DNA-binding transcriptional regulator [Actinocrinis sp.]